ncbi:MAG TPA: O-acetyl-ADP-ribose deacetylase [Candidatus Acidoferrales bacterium]|nr:O-acetyl-ADP-ribose deacetylase [Candidatus Acidoferrales bacterium]
MEFKVGKAILQIIRGDITDVEADAIVNAANSSLMGGGGVDGAIHRKGGSRIDEECRRIRETEWPDGLPTGKAVITSGGNLKAKYVIHTVGPVWMGGFHVEAELLKQAYRNSLKLAVARGLKAIAFPSISTGAYGYPVEEASRVAVQTVKDFLEKEDRLEKVILVLFSEGNFQVYVETAKSILTD